MSLVVSKEQGLKLFNPRIPLKDCIDQKQSSKMGDFGKVRIVTLKDMPNRWFAIKSLLPNPFLSVDLNNNLIIARKLGQHPNFMKVHGIVVKPKGNSSKRYAVFEYIEGDCLSDIDHFPFEQAKAIALQVHAALKHLYQRNIYPVDCHPGNMILTKDTLKLIDFDSWYVERDKRTLAGELFKIMNQTTVHLGVKMIIDKEKWFQNIPEFENA